MVFTYSNDLLEETIKYFLEECNLTISSETATEYLNSLSGLFLAFADIKTSAPPQQVGAEVFCVSKNPQISESGHTSDLIITHNCKNKKHEPNN